MTTWRIEPHSTLDKRFRVFGPDDVLMYVDYDDVNHDQVDVTVREMISLLNEEWDVGDQSSHVLTQLRVLQRSLEKALDGLKMLEQFGVLNGELTYENILSRTLEVITKIVTGG